MEAFVFQSTSFIRVALLRSALGLILQESEVAVRLLDIGPDAEA
jgi:hypothetical protein